MSNQQETQFQTSKIKSILPLQVVLHYDFICGFIYMLVQVVTMIVKLLIFYGDPLQLWLEFFGICIFYPIVHLVRIRTGQKGNRYEKVFSMFLFLLFSLIMAAWHVYLSFFQFIALRFETVINCIMIIFILVEFVIGFYAFLKFCCQ
ncbi:hypothetical protein BLNAU_16624 [Blattamonas nauphoetae]|uniref:Transmembrane protein n=1 Tax=Blattamonas nauphoetae TaxID=2049346 RepID=A0ABQ9XC72_9EUKA|nr:hypothetical protein BLNAU_16624 [Blattamonas nauphoetae]